MQRTPNSFAAHQLIDLAQRQGKGSGVVDALFRAYFEEAKDTGDAAVLAGIAEANGVTGWPAEARDAEVVALESRSKALGISGVPTFIFNRKFGVSGAHPPESLASAIREAIST